MKSPNPSFRLNLEGVISSALGFILIVCCLTTFHFESESLAAEPDKPVQETFPLKQEPSSAAQKERVCIRERWGVEVVSIRLSAAEHMIDFRYRVLDAQKALPLFDRSFKPYLIDQTSGMKMAVPEAPKVGSLRQRPRKPEADRNYFILFTNRGGIIKKGSKFTVVIGDFEAENLVVE